MDWVAFSSKLMEAVKKYRYVLLVLAAGLLLMALPQKKKPQEAEILQAEQPAAEPELQQALEEILSSIEGAGKVKVLLTQAEGSQVLYQMDETWNSGETTSDVRKETVILSGSDRNQTGLIQQVNPPVYLGAVVVCQGANHSGVRLSIVEAVMRVTGLSSDKISVLKMK